MRCCTPCPRTQCLGTHLPILAGSPDSPSKDTPTPSTFISVREGRVSPAHTYLQEQIRRIPLRPRMSTVWNPTLPNTISHPTVAQIPTTSGKRPPLTLLELQILGAQTSHSKLNLVFSVPCQTQPPGLHPLKCRLPDFKSRACSARF